MNDIHKTIINLGFIVLAAVGVCITVALGFFMIFNDKTTTGINYIDEQNGIDHISEIIDGSTADNEILKQYENRYFIEANLYDNKNGNGIILQEMKLNYFMSQKLLIADYYSSGMQYKNLNKLSEPTTYYMAEKEMDNFICPDFNYYSTAIGLSANWGKAQTPLNRNTYYIIKIDGEAYRIKLQGKLDTRYDNRKWYNPFSWFDKGGTLICYDWSDIFNDVMKGIRSNNLGTGTHFAVLDMSRYFTMIEKYNKGNSKWEPQAADLVKNYVAIKFHYSNNGAIRSSQSMFGIINDDPKYDIDESRYDTTYWQERVKYTLTNKDLELRYSSLYDGYFVSLSQDMKTLFKTMPRAEVSITINMTYDGKKIIGLDYNAFKNFRFKTLTITGTGDFYLMTDCLLNTHIETINQSGINLLGDGGAI